MGSQKKYVFTAVINPDFTPGYIISATRPDEIEVTMWYNQHDVQRVDVTINVDTLDKITNPRLLVQEVTRMAGDLFPKLQTTYHAK